jgi:DNA modification methylase
MYSGDKEPVKDCPICHGTGQVFDKELQIGLEESLEGYVSKMVEVFHEVKRVLRDDGTLWLNLGDLYAGGNHGADRCGEEGSEKNKWINENKTDRPKKTGLKSKDMIGLPWRVAFALQNDGWYLRSDIIWAKPNPMPESVTDRPTKAHEFIFLMSKSPKYFYDQEAVREPQAEASIERLAYPISKLGGVHSDIGCRMDKPSQGGETVMLSPQLLRNQRTIWDIPTHAYPDAHFATFPEEIPARCIKAGTSEKGCCPKCGAPWERIVERGAVEKDSKLAGNVGLTETRTKGWKPTCTCGIEETIPCTVLDTFGGSGTTGAVARGIGRSSILIELNPQYVELIKKRTNYRVKGLDMYGE